MCTEIMRTTNNGKKQIKLTIGKIQSLDAEPNKDFSFEPKSFLVYWGSLPLFSI